jgi:hypothetical protein
VNTKRKEGRKEERGVDKTVYKGIWEKGKE